MNAPRDAETASQEGSRDLAERAPGAMRQAFDAIAKPFRGEGMLELVTLLLLSGGCLLVLADFLALFRIEAAGLPVEDQAGRDQHAYAQVVIGVGVIGGALLARTSRQWPPAAATVVLALIALGIALIGDLPEATRSDLVQGARIANASPAIGFWLEIAGAGVTLIAGAAATYLLRRYASSS
jgi:hypothetical protein